MKYILFCDLDGTLVQHHSYNVNDRNVKAICNFVGNNNYFVIATGRWLNRVEKIVDKINYRNLNNVQYVIGLAGAYIYDLKNKVAIYKKSIEPNIFEDLKNLMINNNLPGLVYSDESFLNNSIYVFRLKHKWLLSKFAGNLNYLYISSNDKIQNVYKIIIPCINQKKKKKILDILKELENNLNIMPQRHYIEILQKDTNKASAADYLIKYLNLREIKTAAIGDSPNDIDILNYVDRSFIVANEPNKSQLAYMDLPIINNKDHNAVMHVLNQLLKEQEGNFKKSEK